VVHPAVKVHCKLFVVARLVLELILVRRFWVQIDPPKHAHLAQVDLFVFQRHFVAYLHSNQRQNDYRIETLQIQSVEFHDGTHSVVANATQNPGQNTYRSTVGFMSTSVDGLELVLKAVLSTRPWIRDPAVVPIPYRQDIVTEILSRSNPDGIATHKPLKFGVLWTNGVVEPHPPIRRGLKMVAGSLKKAGHKVRVLNTVKFICRGHVRFDDCIEPQVIDWEPPSHATAKRVHVRLKRNRTAEVYLGHSKPIDNLGIVSLR
jgi:hypothetical protein